MRYIFEYKTRAINYLTTFSIAEYTRDQNIEDSTYGVCGIVMNCSSDPFSNEMHFIICQGEDERIYFSIVIGNLKFLKFFIYSLSSDDASERCIWELATNRWKNTVREDIRGSIILIPHMQLSNQVYGQSVDATFKANEPRELYILNSSAYEVKRFLDQKEFGRGLRIRPDRSLIPTCGTYAKLEYWPEHNHEDNSLLLKILRSQIIFKQEFLKFNPESLSKASPNFHPKGFRSFVRERADLARRYNPWQYRGLKLTFQIWLDNLGPEVVASLTVCIMPHMT